MKKTFYLANLFILLGLSPLLFNNCAQKAAEIEKASAAATSTTEELKPINFFREPIPDRFCGEMGYGYLLRSYLGPECGTCHSMNGMFPPFADNDQAKAYSWGKTLGKENFLSKVVDNRFCGPGCNLDTRGEIYKALVEWLDHRDNCN